MILPEYREPRFAFLDALIAAGWGEIPGRIIEQRLAANGGKLPEVPPEIEAEDLGDFGQWSIEQRKNGASYRAICLAAVEHGINTAVAIAEATGINVNRISTSLSALRCEGALEVIGHTRANRCRMFLYGVRV